MAQGSAVAADVPGRYDVVINGYGYMLLDALTPLIPWRSARAKYSYSPTFLERTNVTDTYGDNAQAFFLTASQNNWELGEEQRYYRTKDPDRSRRFWSGTNIDPVSVAGQVTMRQTTPSISFSEAILCMAEAADNNIYAGGTLSLTQISSVGVVSTIGAHGLGAAPSQWGIAIDSSSVFLTTTTASTVGVRRYNIGGASWSTFSSTAADSLCFLNNQLYGYSNATATLGRYDTSGTWTALYTWKDSVGNVAGYTTRLRQYGGKLFILRTQGVRRPGEMWEFDGTNTSELGDFPANFNAREAEEVAGIIYVSGYVNRTVDIQPTIFFYANGTWGMLWQAQTSGYTNPTWPAIAGWGNGIVFTDDTTGTLKQYNIGSGGVHTIGSYTVTNATPQMAASSSVLVHTRNSTTGYYYPSSSLCSTATIISSLFDFDNSLTKRFRGIKIDYNVPAGSTASFDIAYALDSLTASYTTLQTAAVSGTEYEFASSVTGRALSVKVTMNLGNATSSPQLKRVYVRAAPVLQSYVLAEYVLNLTNEPGRSELRLRDGTYHPLSGAQQVNNLLSAMQSLTPISITDRVNGTFVGVIEPQETDFYEEHPGQKGMGAGSATSWCGVVRMNVRGV